MINIELAKLSRKREKTMYKLRCPKCKAAASLPLTYIYSPLAADGTPSEEEPNVFCLACRHRWHTRLRFHPSV